MFDAVTEPELTSEELAAWRALQWATSLIMSRFRLDLAEQGLSIVEFDVLVHLAWAPEGTLPLQDLTASMVTGDALSRSGLTRVLDRMERDGLVRRKSSPSDRRRFDVVLTAKGRRRFDGVWPDHQDGIRRYFVGPLAPGDVGVITRVLGGLIAANEQALGLRPADD
jgi:DNA-binding MarR family transcriptional regulator